MANIRCPTALTCQPCPDGDPGFNSSAERPDIDSFFAIIHFENLPPLGGTWGATGCVAVCESAVSQEDANLCALRQAQLCTWTQTGGYKDPDGVPRHIFSNSPQSCTKDCP